EPTAPPTFKSTPTPADAEVVILTPEQVQEQAWWWIFGGLACELALIIGTVIGFIRMLIGDENKNGVADWKEEMEPEDLLEAYPDDYRKLYGSAPTRRAPNMSPAYAQTRGKI